MCLHVDRSKKNPNKRIAWKIVKKRTREPAVYASTGVVYKKGAVVRTDEKKVRKQKDTIDYGLHVYTTREIARNEMMWHSSEVMIIKVQVNPKDWVATDWAGEQAVYTKLKVLT